MNQKDLPSSRQSRQRERPRRELRLSQHDALGMLASLVSHDELQREVAQPLSDSLEQENVRLRQSTITRQTFSPLGCNSKHYGLVTSPLERFDTKQRNLYSSASDVCSRGSSLDASSQEVPNGEEVHSLNQVRTLQQSNEMCVRRAISQDWLRKTFSPRPCKLGKEGNLGSVVMHARHSLASIYEEQDSQRREGSDISDSKGGLEQDVEDGEDEEDEEGEEEEEEEEAEEVRELRELAGIW